MRGFLVGVILGLLIVPIALFFYVQTGQAPAAASDAPMPFEKFLARGGLHARIKKEAQDRELSTFTAADLASGADVYRTNCAFCHCRRRPPRRKECFRTRRSFSPRKKRSRTIRWASLIGR
jgi:cytochrome c5